MKALDVILQVLTIIGSLGVFLYGMKLMSESLQKVAGKGMRNLLSAITANRFRGLLSGLFVTGAIQSSSSTTVLIVGFVNAGLLSCYASLAVIMGANIGTTVTGWIISILGFGKTFNINTILLPLVALSLPLLFSNRSRSRSWAEFIFGFAILFLGLNFLKTNVPVLDQDSQVIKNITEWASYRFLSTITFVGIGMILTIIFQSSSATMALTFVLAIDGWVTYEMALAMVLGENIGTTVTANIAAIVANTAAKRSAFFHFLFNLLGALWVLLFFTPISQVIARFIEWAEGLSPYNDLNVIPFALAAFHSGYNILNSILLIGFIPFLHQFVQKIIPSRDYDMEKFRLKHIDSGVLSTSELSIVPAKKEIAVMGKRVLRMLEFIPEILHEKRLKHYNKIIKRTHKYERIIDALDLEIASYITKLSEGRLSDSSTREIRIILRIIDDLESMGDICFQTAMVIDTKNSEKVWFTQEMRNKFRIMYDLVYESVGLMVENLEMDNKHFNHQQVAELEKKIHSTRDQLKQEHAMSVKEESYPYKSGIYFSDIISLLEKIGDYAIKVIESINQSRNSKNN